MTASRVVIKPGREKPILNRHPWIFSGAIARAENAIDGELVTVVDQRDRFLARGYWNSQSQIQVRIMTWEEEPIDSAWWRGMLGRALDARKAFVDRRHGEGAEAFRLVNAENDFIPGLAVDCYGDWAVLQAQTRYIDRRKGEIAVRLRELFGWTNVYERNDFDSRRREGLPSSTGAILGDPPPETIIIDEGVRFHVDIRRGQKTGHYLDQRWNRSMLQELVALEAGRTGKAARLLNLFSYTGGFAISALRSTPLSVINVDSSRAALELAERNFTLNGFDESHSNRQAEFILADGFDFLRHGVASGERFEFVVVDPPKFAQSKRQAQRAARGYKDLNLNAFKLVKEGGYLMTFSCSGAISRELFQKIVFSALADSGRQAQIIRQLSAAADHPVALTFPEGEYLKGLLLRVF